MLLLLLLLLVLLAAASDCLPATAAAAMECHAVRAASSAATMTATSTSTYTPASAMSTAAATHTIAVAANGFRFDPDNITASVGDVLEFSFYPGNHSVARSGFQHPCIPYEDTGVNLVGFFSGFETTQVYNQATSPKFHVRVNDSEPIFYYCSAPDSCVSKHMIGVVNPNATWTLELQEQYLANTTFQISPGEPLPSEASSPSSSPTPSASPSPSSSSSSSSPLSGGKIAGIVVGVLAALALAVAGTLAVVGRRLRQHHQLLHPTGWGYGAGGWRRKGRGGGGGGGGGGSGGRGGERGAYGELGEYRGPGSAVPPPPFYGPRAIGSPADLDAFYRAPGSSGQLGQLGPYSSAHGGMSIGMMPSYRGSGLASYRGSAQLHQQQQQHSPQPLRSHPSVYRPVRPYRSGDSDKDVQLYTVSPPPPPPPPLLQPAPAAAPVELPTVVPQPRRKSAAAPPARMESPTMGIF